MKIISAEQVHASLSYPKFIDSLNDAFAGNYTMPPRQVLQLDEKPGNHDAFAMLPSWNDEVIAFKAFTYFPGNSPPHSSLYSQIMIFDRKVGTPLALIDGISITGWRTAGVSALASRHLSRTNSESMLLIGTGKLAPYLIRAHASVRALKTIRIWGRSPEKAEAIVKKMSFEFSNIAFEVISELASACSKSDIIVCATGSADILVHGDWIQPGTHTDFLGNHHADKRECDSALVNRSRVYVDNKANCFKEAGEILVPVSEGTFSTDQVIGELSDLCRESVPARINEEEITLFKSVGCALGDLCGALTTWRASQ
jgi:1-pyrroline-2-carboxylate reductase [NAD(P)H]